MGKGESTSSQIAQRLNVAHSTVRAWCNKGVFPNARREDTIAGSFWVIPESDLVNFKKPTRGRPAKATKSAAKNSPPMNSPDGKVNVKKSNGANKQAKKLSKK